MSAGLSKDQSKSRLREVSTRKNVLCNKSDLIPNAGICVLQGGEAIAIFYLPDTREKVFALANWDPIGKASVLSRGIVGDVQGLLVVASPLYKQHFDLASGQCLEDSECAVKVYSVDLIGDSVYLTN